MKLLWQVRPVTYPPVVVDPKTRVIVAESQPVEMVLVMKAPQGGSTRQAFGRAGVIHQ
jgi:hypothetical protein